MRVDGAAHGRRSISPSPRMPTGQKRQCEETGVPVVWSGGGGDGLLSKLAANITTISDDLRGQVLRATFERADTDGNGTLSRAEMGSILRKVVVSLSHEDTVAIMDQADPDGDGEISYSEFVSWLDDKAPATVSDSFKRAPASDMDVVRIGFRIWDKDGDGSISRRELKALLKESCPSMTQKQVNALLEVMDTNDDGHIDYDEFVDFLFR